MTCIGIKQIAPWMERVLNRRICFSLMEAILLVTTKLHQFSTAAFHISQMRKSFLRPSTLLALYGITQVALGQEPPLGDPRDAINLLPREFAKEYKFVVPDKPKNGLLDLAQFLTSEVRDNILATIKSAADRDGVNVYLLVVPSVEKGSLEPFTKKVAEEWTKDEFGGVVVFDDETGLVSIEQSKSVSKQFYEFELANLLKERMRPEKKPRLSRAGLQHTVVVVTEALQELKLRSDKMQRDSALGIVLVVGVGLGIAFAIGYLKFRPKGNNRV